MDGLQRSRARLSAAETAVAVARVEIAEARAEIGTALALEQGFRIGDKVIWNDVAYQLTSFGGGGSLTMLDIRGVKLKKNGEKSAAAAKSVPL